MIRRAWQRYGDLLIALAFLAVASLEAAADGTMDTADRIGSAAVALAVAVALWQRRRAPLVLAMVAFASLLLRAVIPEGGEGVAYGPPLLIAAYTCAAHLDGWPLRAGGALTASMATYLIVTEGEDIGGALFWSLAFGVPWVLGRMIRVSRQRQALLQDQARLLEAQRDEQARAAVADERRRIARELHDVVAHAIAVVVLQARGGRRLLDTEPAAAKEAFDVIESTSSEALDEMRRLLGLLRDDGDQPLLPQPTLERIDELAAELRASGLPVELSVSGEPAALPPGVDVSAYRIVQEALTNALKHAGPARARVRIAYEPDAVLVEVTDDGRGATAANGGSAIGGSGHGLVGIRERVALVGGEVEAGPLRAGGYAISARLPYAAER